MATLPWLTPPAPRRTVVVGNPQVGELEFPVHGDLLWGETVAIDAMLADEESTTTAAAQLAETIAEAEGMPLLDAYDWVEGAILGTLSEEQRERTVRYQSELTQLRATFSRLGQARMSATVTALLQQRINPDWTLADTSTLPGELFEAIWQFAEAERRREAPVPLSEDEVKKPPPESSNAPTTKRSRGRSSTPTPASAGSSSEAHPPTS